MNLFRRRRNSAAPPENTFKLACATQQTALSLTEIFASAEQKSMLEKPSDSRGDRILQNFAPTKLREFFDEI